jgi:excinuclease ABC subunit C
MVSPDRLKQVPAKPGVYMFKDGAGEVLYVGKAAVLRNRVRSYFNAGPRGMRTATMTSKAEDVEWITTDTEIEALILESNLIKQYKPRFNIRLRDDKQFPYICITVNEPFPRIFRVRRTRKDGSRYFGPYANSGSLNQTLNMLKKLFPYRSCDIAIPDERDKPEPVLDRPCLEFYIKRCTAPCVRNVTRDEYRETIDQVLMFLEGKHDQVLATLRARMRGYAEALNFEGAAQVRDQITAVERSVERQKISTVTGDEYDVIGIASDGRDASAQVFQIRTGKIVDRQHFMLDNPGEGGQEDILTAFLKQFYERAAHIPRRIMLPATVPDQEVMEQWLAGLRDGPVEILAPQRGEKRKLVDMVATNARDVLEQTKQRWLSDREKTSIALAELEAGLGLRAMPGRIECFDISTIQGASTVASMVVFEDGRAKNSEYRRFQIRTPENMGVGGSHAAPDDFAAMREVIRRRFWRARADVGSADNGAEPADSNGTAADATQRKADSWRNTPDLVVIDGGKGQLGVAIEALAELNIEDLQIVSLAKRHEEVFVPGRSQPIVLPRNSEGLYLLQRIRDEAHRFAVTYHRQVRGRRAQASALDGFRGIGPVKRRALIKTFGSLRGVREASVEEIAAVPGINPTMAASLKQYLAE